MILMHKTRDSISEQTQRLTRLNKHPYCGRLQHGQDALAPQASVKQDKQMRRREQAMAESLIRCPLRAFFIFFLVSLEFLFSVPKPANVQCFPATSHFNMQAVGPSVGCF
jgi:hypothetical protein